MPCPFLMRWAWSSTTMPASAPHSSSVSLHSDKLLNTFDIQQCAASEVAWRWRVRTCALARPGFDSFDTGRP
eukprot:4431437-Amphidinium_carterae.2